MWHQNEQKSIHFNVTVNARQPTAESKEFGLFFKVAANLCSMMHYVIMRKHVNEQVSDLLIDWTKQPISVSLLTICDVSLVFA